MDSEPALASKRFRRWHTLALLAAAFAAGWLVPCVANFCLNAPAQARLAGVVAASFVSNLALLALALGLLPAACTKRWPHGRRTLFLIFGSICVHAGMWLYAARIESPRIFAALALMSIAHITFLFALHAVLARIFGFESRIPRCICAVLAVAAATALFWSRAPILSTSTAASSRAITAVMGFSPPASVGAAWYAESDAANSLGSGGGRFDLVRGPLTYSVWIGSFQAVENPYILPRFEGQPPDRHVIPGLALSILVWTLPLLVLMDFLGSRLARPLPPGEGRREREARTQG